MDRHRHTFIRTYTSTHSYNTHNELYRIHTVDMRQQFVASVWFSLFFFFFITQARAGMTHTDLSYSMLLARYVFLTTSTGT